MHPNESHDPLGLNSPVKQNLGVGIGFRRKFFKSIFETKRQIDWLEIVSENFMLFGGKPRRVLEQAKEKWSIIPHGVSLSLGSVDPLNPEYLDKLKDLADFLDSPWVSDHLCFSSFSGNTYHDLLPLPSTVEAVDHVSERIQRVQNKLGRPFAIENISAYFIPDENEFPESEMICQILEKADCLLLLDVNNVYVNSRNHGFNAMDFIRALPRDRIIQTHLAGHWDQGDIIIDTHGDAVVEPVWNLYEDFLRWLGRPVTTLIEWDNDIPELDIVCDQADRARAIQDQIFRERKNESQNLPREMAPGISL